jgi:drug/metabolite transporter (DMT)-like permease
MSAPKDRASAYVLCLIAAVLFGVTVPASKLLQPHIGRLSRAALLYLGAPIVALPFALRDRRPRLDRANSRRLAGAVLAGGVAAPALLMLGLERAPAGSVALWMNLEPVATAALAVTLFREHGGVRVWIAVVAATVGGVLLAAPEGSDVGLAALLVAASCVLWGLDNNLSATLDATTPAQTTVVKGVAAATVNAALAWAMHEPLPSLSYAAIAAGVGALAIGISLILYLSGAQRLGATRSQLLFATAPFVGAVFAWVGVGEPFALEQGLCAVAMAGAVLLLVMGQHAHEHAHEPMTHTHSHRHDDGHHDHVHEGLPASTRHTHQHSHGHLVHAHAHEPDLHHRHSHDAPASA